MLSMSIYNYTCIIPTALCNAAIIIANNIKGGKIVQLMLDFRRFGHKIIDSSFFFILFGLAKPFFWKVFCVSYQSGWDLKGPGSWAAMEPFSPRYLAFQMDSQ